MLKSINIRNFKGIRELDEPISLSKITVLIGRNESGKSSILEAIYLAASATQGFADPIMRTSTINVLSRKYLSLRNLIFKGSDDLEIELDIDHQDKREKITVLASPYEEVIRKNVEKYGADIVKNLNERLMRLRKEFVRMRRRLQRLERIARLMTMLSVELVQLIRLEEVSLAEKDLEKDVERKLEVHSSSPMHDTLYLCTIMNNEVKNLALAVSHRYGSLTSVVGTRFNTKVSPILIDVIERSRALLQKILKLALEQGLGGKIRENINKYIEVIEDLDFIPGSSLIEPVKCVVKYRGVDRPIEVEVMQLWYKKFHNNDSRLYSRRTREKLCNTYRRTRKYATPRSNKKTF